MTQPYYDRQGKPISRERMYELSEDHDYRVVAVDELTTGWRVSTVWLSGIDHGIAMGGDVLILFETMVFLLGKGGEDYDCARYSTEEQAREGHKAMVAKWSDPLRDAKYRLGDREDME